MKDLLENISILTQKFDKELADSVLEVSIRANWETVENLRGDDSMCQALLEIMEPEISKIAETEFHKGEIKGKILGAIETLRDFGQSDAEIKDSLMKKYNLGEAEIMLYL